METAVRERENKKYRSVSFLPGIIENYKKIVKKFKKLKKYHFGFFSSQNMMEKAEKERKYTLSFRSVPTRPVIKNTKKIAKEFKKLKIYHYGFISRQNMLEKTEKERK